MKEGLGQLPRGLLVGGFSLMLACPAAGQVDPPTPQSIEPGDSVRVKMAGTRPVEGAFIDWRGSSLVMSVPGMRQAWSVPIHEIEALDRYQDRSTRDGFRGGVVLGMAAGVFVGAAVGLGLYATGVTKDEDGPPAEQLMASVFRFSGLFTVGGGLVWGVVKSRNPGRGWVGVSFTTR